VSNYSLFLGKAPDGLEAWSDPDAVFIGGSGGELAALIVGVMRRLRPGGRLVMNFVTLENLATATTTLQGLEPEGVTWDVLQLQAARSKPILHMHRMAAENPVWIVCAERDAHNEGAEND
jgi:precorrin-6Y C5,15-methyltransferase (decarboxylating)